MGSPKAEKGRGKDEQERKVKISEGFWIMETETTQEHFKKLMGYTSKKECPYPNCPVSGVTWNEAALFSNKLSKVEGLPSCFSCVGRHRKILCKAKSYKNYNKCKGWKLPTEAQWEYAARAGTQTAFYTGKCIPLNKANYDGTYSSPCSKKSACSSNKKFFHRFLTIDISEPAKRGFFHAITVSNFSPNNWGLYDMAGNVWEWSFDWYRESNSSTIDPIGPPLGKYKIIRGGGWRDHMDNLRSANRMALNKDFYYDDVGFRLVRNGKK